jgi:AraC-like DNA-binding protein
MMLRGHFDQAACSNDLMKILAAPPSARAVTAMLMAPARAWTLDALAAEARVSRATVVRIFRRAAGLALIRKAPSPVPFEGGLECRPEDRAAPALVIEPAGRRFAPPCPSAPF